MTAELRLTDGSWARLYKIGTCPDNQATDDYNEWARTNLKSTRWYFGDVYGISVNTDCVMTEIYDHGRLTMVEYDRGGRLHRKGGPARINYGTDGAIMSELWCVNGYAHRKGAPAWISRESNGLVQQVWQIRSKLHRTDGPADEWRWGDIKCSERWFINGTEHRIGAPSSWSMWSSTQYQYANWKVNGKYHRADGPASQEWEENSNIAREEWYAHGKLVSDWLVIAQIALPVIHALLPQPIVEEIAEQFAV